MAAKFKLPIESGDIQLLRLNDTHISLVCEKLLNWHPKKYWCCFGHWGEQSVIAKIFANPHQAHQELNVTSRLTATNINTPRLLYHGWAIEKPLYVIIYECIQPKHTFLDYWQSTDATNRIDLLNQLVLITAQLHQAGIKQNDPKNFLSHNEKIYVLSSANIEITKTQRPLSNYSSLKNLGLQLAQFPPRYDALCSQLYLAYTKTCGSIFRLTNISKLNKWIRYWRKQQLIQSGKKVFHTNNQFICDKNWWQSLVYSRDYDTETMRALLKDPDKILQTPNTEILKADNSSTVGKVVIDGHTLIIKRHNLKNFWQAIKRACWLSRAAKNWRNAEYLRLLDLATAKPIALIEKRFGPFRRESYFISEFIPANHLQNFLSTSHTPEKIELIAENIAQLFADLGEAQIAHGDMKATNILIVDDKPLLLDLDAMYLYRTHWRWQRAARDDKRRFMKNWENQPEIKEIFQKILKNN